MIDRLRRGTSRSTPHASGAGVSRSRYELRWASFLACLVTAALALAVSPRYEVPQTDDWVYRLEVLGFLREGKIVDLGWADPTLVLHIVWGSLFAALFGPEYSVLRASTLLLMPCALTAGYVVLRGAGLNPMTAAAAALIVVLQPIALLVSYSYNTDFPYLALSTLTIALVLRADRKTSVGAWLGAGVACGAAFLVRQPALFTVPIVLLAIWTGRRPAPAGESRARSRVAASLAFLLPLALALLAAAILVPRRVDPSRMANVRAADSLDIVSVLSGAFREAVASGHTLALFVLPLLVAGVRWRGLRGTAVPAAAALALGGGLLLLRPWLSAEQLPQLAGWPYQGEYLARRGIMASHMNTQAGTRQAWTLLTLVLPFVLGWLIVRSTWVLGETRVLIKAVLGRPAAHAPPMAGPSGGRAGVDFTTRARWIVLGMGTFQFVPFLFAHGFYDRYLLPAVLPTVVLAMRPLAGTVTRIRQVALVAGVLILALASAEWLRFHVDRSRAVWAVAEELVERGTAVEEIQAGFEWAGHHLFLRALEELDVPIPVEMENGFPWRPLTARQKYTVVERRRPPDEVGALFVSYRALLSSEPRYAVAQALSAGTRR